jgi:hypothetical protein
MKNLIWITLVSIVTLTSCDNTLDINAPWKETPVIYAVIDMGQDSQIFRIQKTYQNDISQSTIDLAQVADSLYMKNISVKIVSGNNPNTFKELKRLAPRKEAGFFSNKDSSYWGEYMPNWFAPTVKYKLVIHSFETGNEYQATTDLVGRADITAVNATSGGIDLVNTSASLFSYQIKALGLNAVMVDLIIRLNYNEVNLTTNDTTAKYVDFYLKKGEAISAFTNSAYNTGVLKTSVVSYFKNNIKVDASVRRTFTSIEYGVIGYNSIFKEMLLVNAPSGSIIPKYGEYTNINNGIGVFAARTYTHLAQLVNTASINMLNTEVLNPQ